MHSIVNGTVSNGETLPTYARTLQFRFTVRDNRPGGGGLTYDDDPATLTVINTVTPFQVTWPNLQDYWAIGTSYTVTWNVSSTDLAPINCQHVNILLSIDGGYTYPVVLAVNTPNDGSEEITIPLDASLVTNTARIMVEAADNIFFDISDHNIAIGTNTAVENSVGLSSKLEVYPNPTNGLLNISLNSVSSQTTNVRIIDLIGKTIIQQTFEKTAGQKDISVDLSNEPNGIYTVEVLNETGTTVKKVVKQ